MDQSQKNAEHYKNLLLDEIEQIIIGKREQISLLVMAVFSGGHVLLDDLPGSGKTTLIKTLSLALSCDFCRIQFTPDLLPSDILGMTVFNQKTGDFQLRKGPVFTNILLADEINRAIPRTQSALLEAMEEQQVTIDGESLKLPSPFFVMATQNPVERESTFPLPAAQMDRFFIKMSLGYPSPEEENLMLERLGNTVPYAEIHSVLSPEGLAEVFAEIDRVHVSTAVRRYIVSLVHATRNHPLLETGASPRASKALFQGGKAWAAMEGRSFVTPDDIKAIAVPVLSHRITLKSQARFSGTSSDSIIQDILASTEISDTK
ncbi:MoxR family ATPase [Clostridium sp. AM58-1XD]|uniref:AAA family ATPase n=1 Tax=Clostridium sp. AM58-1XD TaxID=2292307 RepID=UPI000E51DD93|nr:MoxR family ATPase [Clostridium sp. AM58-1XD]RGZ01252.1 MoxR family ATPase [Clostridium sp. AM58-1XD]